MDVDALVIGTRLVGKRILDQLFKLRLIVLSFWLVKNIVLFMNLKKFRILFP